MTSCSEDALLQTDEQESMYSTNSFNDNGSGGTTPGGSSILAINYYSPWDIWYNRGNANFELQPSYTFNNGNVDDNFSPYRLEVYAWVGLAYFDGTNDGVFNDISQPGLPPVANMIGNPMQYPNLFTMTAGGQPQEVGNLVKTTTSLDFDPLQSARIEDREHHLPMPYTSGFSLGTLANPRYTTPPYTFGICPDGFNFTGTLQPEEELLLRDYGKVFFYEVDVFEAATGAFVDTYILHPEIQTLYDSSTPEWRPVTDISGTTQLQGNLPFGSFNLFYYTDGSLTKTAYNVGSGGVGNHCNSFEVIFDAPKMHQYTITGSVPKTLTMGFSLAYLTFWKRSALSLRID